MLQKVRTEEKGFKSLIEKLKRTKWWLILILSLIFAERYTNFELTRKERYIKRLWEELSFLERRNAEIKEIRKQRDELFVLSQEIKRSKKIREDITLLTAHIARATPSNRGKNAIQIISFIIEPEQEKGSLNFRIKGLCKKKIFFDRFIRKLRRSRGINLIVKIIPESFSEYSNSQESYIFSIRGEATKEWEK